MVIEGESLFVFYLAQTKFHKDTKIYEDFKDVAYNYIDLLQKDYNKRKFHKCKYTTNNVNENYS